MCFWFYQGLLLSSSSWCCCYCGWFWLLEEKKKEEKEDDILVGCKFLLCVFSVYCLLSLCLCTYVACTHLWYETAMCFLWLPSCLMCFYLSMNWWWRVRGPQRCVIRQRKHMYCAWEHGWCVWNWVAHNV